MTTTAIVSSAWLVALLLDVSLKMILLAVLAGAAMWLFRVRATSVRHRVWSAVLGGMLAMPLLVAWSPTVPLPRWAYPDLRLGGGRELAVDDSNSAPAAPPFVAENPPVFEPAIAPQRVAVAPAPTTIDPSRVHSAVEPPAWIWAEHGSMVLVACYALGVVFFGGRLLVGLSAAGRLVRTARPVELSPEHAAEIGRTRVLESSRVRVPLTVGWLRPKIVLPGDWSTWDAAMLAAVLAHEQAHVQRRDPWVALVAQVNRAIYWFHPLSWFLTRRLTALAEEACDDVVIESLGDRAGYARQLLAIAGRLNGQPRRLQPVGVAMAARPAVEDRVEAILDDRRPLARRVSWLGTLILLAVITPAVLLAAGIAADNENPHSETDLPVALASDTGTLRLIVLDDNDAPVPGANVTVRIRQVFMGQDTWKHQQTDDAGKLKIDVPTPTPYYLSAQLSVPGYVPFLAEWENHDTPDPIPAEYTARLDAGRTIGGIVRDSKGKAIEGVSVSPEFDIKLREERTYQMGSGASVKTNTAGEWTYASLPTDLQQVPLRFRHSAYVPARATEPVSKVAIPAGGHPSAVTTMKQGIVFAGRVTDADGEPVDGATARYSHNGMFSSDSPTATTDKTGDYRFTSGEIGNAILTVSASGLAPAMQSIEVAEKMPPVNFHLNRGAPLSVRVVGPDQKPLEGAYVSLWNWDEQGVDGSLSDSHGKTNANGEWQWAHAPQGSLQFAVSLAGYRYIPGVEVTPGEDNVVVMTRQSTEKLEGQMLKFSGSVLDAGTNAPIARFRVTAGYQREAGGRTIWLEDTRSKGRNGAFRREFTHRDLGTDVYSVALRVEADGYSPAVIEQVVGGRQDFEAHVALEKAANDGYRVLLPNGEAAAGATVAVCTPEVGPIVQDGLVIPNSTCERTTSDATGRFAILPQKGRFDLLVLHDSGAKYVPQMELAKSHTISLEPWARVEGTLRMHEKPAANESIRLDRADSPLMNAPNIFYQYETKTDESGKFSFEQVVPGNGHVARVAVSQLGGGMSSSTPTLVVDATFAAGETTHVELGRTGRQVVGKLLMRHDAKPGNDWRLAMIMLQSRQHDAPKQPRIPFPLHIDPKKDQDAAKLWWEQWRFTGEGKEFQKEMKRYADAVNGFKPVYYSGRVEPDGTFSFDDVPRGDYTLDARAVAPTADRPVGPGETIANLKRDFVVPEPAETGASEPVNLGGLTLQAFEPPKTGP